ncbi:MAG TPA: YibE/F family protein, partial [Xanthomonadales bacterium]|nr:YibE/F family protein [Xanthomonadales bacterium]
ITSLVGMAVSFLMIFFVVLPQILKGHDPITVAILSSLVIIPVSFYMTHGVNKKTTSAVMGTVISLVITGLLANFFVNIGHLTGFTSDEASFLETAKKGAVQMKGLLLAGIIIGALGVLDDITISQSAIVFQLRNTSEKLKFWQVYKKAMDIGRDHIASMVNTLVLVYTGAALPLLLIFIDNPRPFTEIINYEMISEEIIRTIVVSIGLILAVPLVTLIAAVLSDQEFKRATKEILHSLK